MPASTSTMSSPSSCQLSPTLSTATSTMSTAGLQNVEASEAGGSLRQLLADCQLAYYYTALTTKLRVVEVEHLKYTTEADLAQIGMSKPEQRRLWKLYHRRYPSGLMNRLKKRVFSSSSSKLDKENSQSKQTQDDDGDAEGTPGSRDGGSAHQQDQHIIPLSAITRCKKLGEGEFGEVWQGVWTPGGRGGASGERRGQQQEAAIMHKICHRHVVRLFGVVLDTKSLMLVTELAPLRSLLECLKEPALRPSFAVLRVCEFGAQICDGMAYLEARRLIHRDLAARNILVFSADRVKISDFGLSRSLSVGEEYYRTNFSLNLKLPIAWCAPECINFLKFTSSSDVWAFAVTLWEMFTYGFQPWAGMTGQQILLAIDSPKSQRLETPDSCPNDYYSLMLQCWAHEPANRPKFSDLTEVLPEIKPERVQAISACQDGQPDHLQYSAHQIITVLNKRPREYPDGYYWKGVLDSGRTGLFVPTNTVAFIDVDYPTLNGFVTDMSKHADKSSSSSRSKALVTPKLSRSMISAPVGDVTHTGHLGIDGNCFGDVVTAVADTQRDREKHQLPRQVVAPLQQNTQSNGGGDRPASSASSASPRPTFKPPPDPPRQPRRPKAALHTNNEHQQKTQRDKSDGSDTCRSMLIGASPLDDSASTTLIGRLDDDSALIGRPEDASAPRIGRPVLDTTALSGRRRQPSPSPQPPATLAPTCAGGDFDSGDEFLDTPSVSLLDEVFGAMQVSTTTTAARTNDDTENLSVSDMDLDSNWGEIGEVNWKETSKLLSPKSQRKDITGGIRSASKPEALVRPISGGDAKIFEDLKTAAYKVVDKSFEREREHKIQTMIQLGLLEPPADCAAQSVKRMARSFKLKRHSKDSSPAETGTFVDQLKMQRSLTHLAADEQAWTCQAQDAYKTLIECGKTLADYPAADTKHTPRDAPAAHVTSHCSPARRETAQPPPANAQTLYADGPTHVTASYASPARRETSQPPPAALTQSVHQDDDAALTAMTSSMLRRNSVASASPAANNDDPMCQFQPEALLLAGPPSLGAPLSSSPRAPPPVVPPKPPRVTPVGAAPALRPIAVMEETGDGVGRTSADSEHADTSVNHKEQPEETNPLRILRRGSGNGSINKGARGVKLPSKGRFALPPSTTRGPVAPPPAPPPKPKCRGSDDRRFAPPPEAISAVNGDSVASSQQSQPAVAPSSAGSDPMDFTFESVNKYELLDFVMAAFDGDKKPTASHGTSSECSTNDDATFGQQIAEDSHAAPKTFSTPRDAVKKADNGYRQQHHHDHDEIVHL